MKLEDMCEYICHVNKKHNPEFNQTPEEILAMANDSLGSVLQMWREARMLEGHIVEVVWPDGSKTKFASGGKEMHFDSNGELFADITTYFIGRSGNGTENKQ